MKISIILPSYNTEKFLCATLESILAQTHKAWELIVVDDGSSDQTPAIARQYAGSDRRIRCFSQPNSGVAAARNRALSQMSADTEAIALIDSDDIWEPDTLETLLAALTGDPQCIGAHGLGRYIDSEGEPIRPGEFEAGGRERRVFAGRRLVPVPSAAPTTFEVLILRYCIPVGSVLIRRAAMEAAGPFDEAYRASEDWDMWLRLSLLGEFAFVDKVVFGYRQHGTNLTRNAELIYRADQAIYCKLLASPALSEPRKRLVRQSYRLREKEACFTRLAWAWSSARAGSPWAAAKQLRHGAANALRSLRAAPPPERRTI